jgi:copper chaperone
LLSQNLKFWESLSLKAIFVLGFFIYTLNSKELLMEKTVIKVNGMSCEHCVHAVSRAAEALGVKAAVDLKGGTVALEYDPEKTALDAIKAAITEEGYEVV